MCDLSWIGHALGVTTAAQEIREGQVSRLANAESLLDPVTRYAVPSGHRGNLTKSQTSSISNLTPDRSCMTPMQLTKKFRAFGHHLHANQAQEQQGIEIEPTLGISR